MILLSRRSMLAIVAVLDVALNARPHPVAAKVLAARHNLPPRHLETMLQALVRAGILKGMRGPRGGYELAMERRKISAGDIVRAAIASTGEDEPDGALDSPLIVTLVGPMVEKAGESFLARLDEISIDELCGKAEKLSGGESGRTIVDLAV